MVRKISKPRIQQCKCCWDFHSEKTCTRKLRCRLCGAKDHTEEGHKYPGLVVTDCNCPDRCVNCRGPHAADDIGCPIHPCYKESIIQHKTKSQKEAIWKPPSSSFYAKHTVRICKANLTQSGTESQIGTSLFGHLPNSDIHNYQASSPLNTDEAQW